MQKTPGLEDLTVSYISKKWTNMCRIYKDCKKFLATSNIPWSYYYIFDNYYNNKNKKKVNSNEEKIQLNCRLCYRTKGVYILKEEKSLCDLIKQYTTVNVSIIYNTVIL